MIFVGSGLKQEPDMGYEHPSCQPVRSTVVDLHAYKKTNCRTRQSHTRGFACDLTSKEQIRSHLGWAKGLLLFYSTWYSVEKGVTPKATSQGEQPISRTLALEGPRSVLERLHPDICLRVERLHPGDISSGDPPLFPTAREEAENKPKGGELSVSGLQTCTPPCQRILGCNRFTWVLQDCMKPSRVDF